MPVFEYICQMCRNEFEELVFDRDACPPCPKCGSEETGKLMSAVRSRIGSHSSAAPESSTSPAPSGGGCSGCSGGNCSSCG